MKLIDGKLLAQNLRGEIAAGVASLKAEKGVTPGLAVILVGDNPASVSYVTAKEKACTEAGMLSREIRLPAETTEAELVSLVKELNAGEVLGSNNISLIAILVKHFLTIVVTNIALECIVTNNLHT